MRTIFLLLLISFLSSVHAVSEAELNDLIVEKTSEAVLLNQAKLKKKNDQQSSVVLANEALKISEVKNNHNVTAQAHSFLGELALESNNIALSMQHFIQASILYKSLEDKRYQEVDKVIDELLPSFKQYEDTLPIAQILIDEADRSYKQKHFIVAIKQYSHALKFLTSSNNAIHKIRAETYKKIAQSYKRLKNREQTVYFYQKTLEVFTSLQDQLNMARTLNSLSEAERYLNDYVASLDYSIQAMEIYKRIDDLDGYAKALIGAGIIYRYIGLYDKSLQHIYEAHLYYNKVNNINGIANTSNQMGLIYTRLKQFEQAKSFYQLTTELPQDKVESKTIASAFRELAVIDLNSRHYESAKQIAMKAYDIYKKSNNKTKQSITARIIGNVYREELNYDQAIVYYRESLSIATEVGSIIYQIKALTPLAAMLFNYNIEESIILLNKALLLAEEIDSNSSRLYIYRELRKAEKLRGNFEASVNYAEQEIFYTGIIQSENDDNELILVKAKLYSHKIEMELVALRDKAKQNQLELLKKNNEIEIAEQTRTITELKLTKNRYANFALGTLLLVCFSAVIFFYWRFINSRKRNRELDELAARDPLTNCYNRRILFERMDDDFKNSDKLDEYFIIMADIDYFKVINDTYGHNAGDAVICGVSDVLQRCVRKTDIVSRFGGEEFCIVLYSVSKVEALEITENMRSAIESSNFESVAVTCSFGITSINFGAQSTKELVYQADLALYQSKSLGRNKVIVWNKGLKK